MPAKRRRYAGELATPIVWPAPPTFEGAVTEERVQEYRRKCENHQREVGQRVEQKLLEKISLLMKHYGITDETTQRRSRGNSHLIMFRVSRPYRKFTLRKVERRSGTAGS